MNALDMAHENERHATEVPKYFASPYPSLAPSAILRWRFREKQPFPFSEAAAEYFFLARNGIYHLAKRWALSGQEVLFPSYFHGVELSALVAAGVVPKFFRVDSNMRVDLDDLKSKINPGTRAIYLIHYLGFPGPVREVQALCREHSIPLIEDCALALLSCAGEQPLGSFGAATIFCLYKTLPVPDGGVLIDRGEHGHAHGSGSRRPSIVSTLARLTSSISYHYMLQGRMGLHAAIETVRRAGKSVVGSTAQVGTNDFDIAQVSIGMSRASSWLIRTQRFTDIVDRRRRNFLRLLARLGNVSPPVFEELPPGICPLFYPIRAARKTEMLGALARRGVEAVNFWSYEHPLADSRFSEASELRRTVIELPCHQDLAPEDIDRIADAVCDAWR